MRFTMWMLLIILAILPIAVLAQPNVTPRTVSWMDEATEVDIRLKGQPTATNPAGPTVRLFSAVKFDPQNNAKIYDVVLPCWNKADVCPAVHGVTFRVFLKLPGGARTNVTGLTGLCGFTASECVTPWFVPITAKPVEGYRFQYDSLKAVWVETPSIVTLLPDLLITSLTYSSATGIFTSVVKNQGTTAILAGAGFGVGYSVDGVYRTWGGFTGPLAPGESVTIGTDGVAFVIPPGGHTISAWVDDASRITEMNETNNGFIQTITVGN